VIRDLIANRSRSQSALTSLEARVLLVDDVDAALAANQAVIAMTGLKRFKRILDLHFTGPQFCTVSAVLFKQSKARNGARSFRLAGRYLFEPCLSTLARVFALKD